MADTTRDMIISEEQVQRAIEYLQTSETHGTGDGGAHPVPVDLLVPSELLSRVTAALSELPDVREDRVAEARMRINGTRPASEDVASKLIGRVISDAIR